MIKLVVFDLDGTICHTPPIGVKAFVEGVLPYSKKEISEEEILQTYGLNEKGIIKILLPSHHEEAYNDFYALYKKYHESVTEPYEGIGEIFSLLKEHDVKIALITGRGEESCMYTLEKLKIKEIFSDIGTGEEDRQNKCEIMLELLKKYGLAKNEVLYVGDADTDVIESNRAGVRCLSVCWGHDVYIERVKKINAENMFYSTKELEEHLKSII